MASARNTIQKSLILSALQALDHPTAEQVYAFVVQQNPQVSKGTVYRNLNALVSRGELRRVQLPAGADVYDLTCRPHYHIRCTGCGRVADVELDYLRDLVDRVGSSSGFLIEEHDIWFHGLCADCQKKNDGGKHHE